MKSGLTEVRIDTAGTSFSSTTASVPSPDNAACTLFIKMERSEMATLLLLTCAATMSAVSVTSISLVSAWSDMRLFLVYITQKQDRRILDLFFRQPDYC